MIEDKKVDLVVGVSGMHMMRPLSPELAVSATFVGWNVDADGRITDIAVTDSEKSWRRIRSRYAQHGGMAQEGWMVAAEHRPKDSFGQFQDELLDPIGLFGVMMATGFENRGVYRKVLVAFARIDSCEWARRQLYSIDGHWKKSDLHQAL